MTRRIPRWLARAPIGLYRQGLGWLLGPRLVMVEHRGRRSGEPRYVVLEVVDREPGALVVVSGYGPRSQWLRNIQHHASVRIWAGRSKAQPAIATVMTPAETRARLEKYRQVHPLAAAGLGRLLDLPDLRSRGPISDDVAERLPLVRIRRA